MNMHQLNFSELPWLANTWQRLQQLRRQQRLPHAFILHGQQGIGKHLLVRELMQSLICLHDDDMTKPCQRCRACHLFSLDQHPDVYYLRTEDASHVIKIDDVRQVLQKLQHTPQLSAYRCVFIENANALNVASANALLKTLEEPHDNTVIILQSHQLHQLLATIRSRCQLVHCQSPNPTEALQLLEQHFPNRPELSSLLVLCNQAPWRVADLLEDDNNFDLKRILQALLAIRQQQLSPIKAGQQLLAMTTGAWLLACLQKCISLSLNTVINVQSNNITQAEFIALLNNLQQSRVASLLHFFDDLLQWQKILQNSASINQALLIETTLVKFANV